MLRDNSLNAPDYNNTSSLTGDDNVFLGGGLNMLASYIPTNVLAEVSSLHSRSRGGEELFDVHYTGFDASGPLSPIPFPIISRTVYLSHTTASLYWRVNSGALVTSVTLASLNITSAFVNLVRDSVQVKESKGSEYI